MSELSIEAVESALFGAAAQPSDLDPDVFQGATHAQDTLMDTADLLVGSAEVSSESVALAAISDIHASRPSTAAATARPSGKTYQNGQAQSISSKKQTESSRGRKGSSRDKYADDFDLVGQYLKDIGQYELLTKDDEFRLAEVIKQGRAAQAKLEAGGRIRPEKRQALEASVQDGQQAKQDFLHANLRLVVSVAKRYQASGIPLLDLIQEGNLGLDHAIDLFDHLKGFKFSTYATWWIRQAIERSISNTASTIRIPVHMNDHIARYNRVQAQRINGERLTDQQVADKMSVKPEKIDTIRVAANLRQLESLDAPFSDAPGSGSLSDLLPDSSSQAEYDSFVDKIANSKTVEVLLDGLDPRERKIVMLRYGFGGEEPWVLQAIADEFRITREAVGQTLRRSMAKMRDLLAEQSEY